MSDAALELLLLDELAMLIDDCDALSTAQQPDPLAVWPSAPPSLQRHFHPIPFGSSDEALLRSCDTDNGGGDERSAEESQRCRSLDGVLAGEREEAERTLRSEMRKRQKNAQRMNRSQREKARLVLLRLEASQLQLALDALRKTSSCKKRSISVPRPSLAAASVWEPLVKRQQKERTRAETENAELKKMLAAQVRFIKALERRMHQQLQTADETQGHKRHFSANVTPAAMKIFEELLNSSDARVSTFDQVFEAHNLNSAVSSNKRLSEAHAAYNDELGTHFNFVESSVLPFGFVATANTIWEHMATGEATPTQHTEIVEQTEDMLATVRVKVFKKASCETTCTTIYSVYKRIVKEGHVRLVWECFAESKEDPQSDVVLLQWMHTDWTKVSRSYSRDGSAAALIQSFARINPPLVSTIFGSQRVAKQSRLQRQDPSAFADALIASYQASVQSARQRIENELIDNFCKPRRSSKVAKSS